MKTEKRKRFLFTYLLFVCLSIGLLSGSDDIFVHLLKGSNEYVIENSKSEFLSSGFVEYGIDEIKMEENSVEETFSFIGWAYLASDKNNENRKVKIVFSSEKNTYIVETSLYLRKEIYHMNRDMVKGKSDKFGFGTQFSTIPMKDGIYKIGIYVEENPTEKGFVWIPRTIEKNKGMISVIDDKYVCSNKEVPNIKASESDMVKYSVDEINEEKGILRGWILQDGFDCDKQKVYIQVSEIGGNARTIEAISYGRLDEREFSPKRMYINRGFFCKLPDGMELNSNCSKIEIIVQTTKLLKSKSPYYYRADENKKVNSIKADISKDIQFSVDYAGINKNDPDIFEIVGWVNKKGVDSRNQYVYIEMTDSKGEKITYGASTTKRDDLVQYFGENARYGGYSCSIPVVEANKKEYTIRVILKADALEIADSYVLYRADAGERVAKIEAGKSDQIVYSVDYIGKNQADKNFIRVEGWIYKKGFAAESQSVYVQLTGENGEPITYGAYPVLRNDLVQYYGENAQYAGYNCLIPSKEFGKGKYNVEIFLKTNKIEKPIGENPMWESK